MGSVFWMRFLEGRLLRTRKHYVHREREGRVFYL